MNIYKCPVCGIDLVQPYGHRIPGTNHRITHCDSVVHAMLYTSEQDADGQSYDNCSSSLRPYKDGKVFREVYSETGEVIGREWEDIQQMKNTQSPAESIEEHQIIPLTRDALDKIATEIKHPESCRYAIDFLLKHEKQYGHIIFNTAKEVQQFVDVLKKHGYESDEYQVMKRSCSTYHVDTTYNPPFGFQVRGYSPPGDSKGRVYCSTLCLPFKDEVK